jgi:hypothetical protein
MTSFIRDIRFACKLLIKDRGYTATALLTLAVCIAANAAIFTIVNSVLLHPLPVPESDRILIMSNQYPAAGVGRSDNSGAPDYYDRLRDVTVFEEQAMFNLGGQTTEINGTPERIRTMAGTPSLFRLLRIAPAIGRIPTEEEGQPDRAWQVLSAGPCVASAVELRSMAATVWWRPQRCWKRTPSERPAIHRHWSHAEKLSVFRSRCSAVDDPGFHGGDEVR